MRSGHEPLGELLKKTKHPVAIARAVDIYCSSRSWDQANTHYNHVIEPVIGNLDQAQMRRILLAARNEGADLNGAHSFSTFVRYVYENDKLPRSEIITTLRDNGITHLAARLEAEPGASQDDDDFPF